MINFDKKGGIAIGYVVRVLVTLTVCAVIILFLVNMAPLIEDSQDRGTCTSAVKVAAHRISIIDTEIGHGGEVVDLAKACPIVPVEDVEIDNQNDVFKVIADRLLWTYEDFGKGKANLNANEDAIFCHPRYGPITFKPKGKKFNNFYYYLMTTSPDDSGIPYFTRLTGKAVTEELKKSVFDSGKSGSDGIIPNFIDTDIEYAVVYIIGKDSHDDGLLNAVFDDVGEFGDEVNVWTLATGLGGTIFSSTFVYFFSSETIEDFSGKVVVLPYKDIHKLRCTNVIVAPKR